MTKQEFIFRIIELGIQIILIVFAGMALFVWKKEIRGRDRYNQAKLLLEYIKKLRFLIHSKNGSMHQIYLNDILVDSKKFYKNQLLFVSKEKVYFDESVCGLFSHINIRSDIFLPERIRDILSELCPVSTERVDTSKNRETYIQIFGTKVSELDNFRYTREEPNCICRMNNTGSLTIETYFKKWEKLIKELQKIT